MCIAAWPIWLQDTVCEEGRPYECKPPQASSGTQTAVFPIVQVDGTITKNREQGDKQREGGH